MNLTEQYRAKVFAFVASPSSEGPGWKGYALRITVLALGLGLYVLLFRRKNSSGGRWSGSRGSRDVPDGGPGDDTSSVAKELSDDDAGPVVPYNGEICPICLGVPKIGVKTPCGHLLCADCLASYCDVRIAPAPPPCPLCRAPLNSVALACDFNLGWFLKAVYLCRQFRPQAILSSKTVGPNTIMVQDWIREYNNHRGLMTQGRTVVTTRFIFFFNILTLFLLVGLIATRLQVI